MARPAAAAAGSAAPVALGLDTSCYTTSVAAVDESGRTVLDRRHVLDVPAGSCGLRQSDALFQHLRDLPPLLEEALNALTGGGFYVSIVACSSRPRPAAGSYLPVFLAGAGFARALAAATGSPLVAVSHQEGHLAAALPQIEGASFLALQISGGTTDLLLVRRASDEERAGAGAAAGVGAGAAASPATLIVCRLGGSADLHAGQFVDRVGVALGIPFPAGRGVDALAAAGDPSACPIPSAVRRYRASFSGPHAAALRLVAAGSRPADVAAATLACVAKSAEKLIRRAVDETGVEEVAVVGGVAASPVLRARLKSRLPFPGIIFPPPELCPDNAVGVARLGWAAVRSGR